MKVVKYILLALVIILLGGFIYLYNNMENLVKTAVNKYGSQVTGTEVKLGGFGLSPLSGELKLRDLTVANPKGYTQPTIIKLGEVYVKLNLKSLKDNLIVVEKVKVANPEVTYELKNVTDNNVSDLLANISKNTASGSKSSESTKTESSKSSDSSSKKVAVDLVNVNDGKINIAASIAGQGASAGIPLPDIELTGIGRDKSGQGQGIVETVTQILKKILNVSYDTVINNGLGSLKDVATDSLKAVSDTADDLKENAKDLIKGIF